MVAFLIVFILDLPRLLILSDMRSGSLSYSFVSHSYFGLLGLVLGEADAAGEGLAAGLGLVTGAVALAGDVDGELAVVGEFELLSGSLVQAAANTIADIVRSRSAMRLIMFTFGVLISFSLIPTRLKSGMIIAWQPISSNGCSHRRYGGISARSAPKPSVSKKCLHD
jgi:hypothetical protein